MSNFKEIANSCLAVYKTNTNIKKCIGKCLPSRKILAEVNDLLISTLLPIGDATTDTEDLSDSMRRRIERVAHLLEKEIACSFKYFDDERVGHEKELVAEILLQLQPLCELVQLDAEAAFRGDPAAKSYEEVILAYPGLLAISIHRFTHELWIRKIPLIPRIMSELIHSHTGIDIHPGAQIGKYFFIDHATGVVIGETAIIHDHVKIYQGVTLGAISVDKSKADKKRHPTICENVTIYSGATILGGDTTIGKNSLIGANVWLLESVPQNSTIYNIPNSIQKTNSILESQ